MVSQQNLGRLCPYSKSCPVFRGETVVENISSFLIKNVFCNRGNKGWKNCERFRIQEAGGDVPDSVTPYKQKVTE